MARTPAGATLTEAHRAAQLAVRAGSLRDLVTLWRAVDPTNLSDTIGVFARAAAILAGRGYEESGRVSARYYQLFRRVEGVGGTPAAAIIARPPTVDRLAAEMRGASLAGIITARRAGLDVQTAKTRGFIRAAGALGKLVLNGGRRTLITIADNDRQALGWSRVTSGDPCPFCRMLASRGPHYKTEKSADFQPHDDCGCAPEIVYSGSALPGDAAKFAEEWQAAQRIARQDGTGSTGTSNNALNNYRRYLSGGATASASPVTEESG